jgi:hypothetical protein
MQFMTGCTVVLRFLALKLLNPQQTTDTTAGNRCSAARLHR